MRLIFMGTPGFAVPALQRLIDETYEIVAVYTQPPRPSGRGQKLTPSPIHQLAEKHGIPVHTPTSLKGEDEQKIFADYKADIAVVAAYGMLLPKPILDAPRLGCINIHPSDLPRWRGAAPLQRTIMAGDTHTACCIMYMEEGLDTGAVLARCAYAIPENMTTGELHDVMAMMGANMLPAVIDGLNNGNLQATPQSAEGVTYAKKITKDDELIDWSKPAAEIHALIRGLAPNPGAATDLGGERVKLLESEVISQVMHNAAGSLSLADGLQITCGDGRSLRINLLKRPGKQAQPSADALRGWQLHEGIISGNNA